MKFVWMIAFVFICSLGHADHSQTSPQSTARPVAEADELTPQMILSCIAALKKGQAFPPSLELSVDGTRVNFIQEYFISEKGIYRLELGAASKDIYREGRFDRYKVKLPWATGVIDVSGAPVGKNVQLVATVHDTIDPAQKSLEVSLLKTIPAKEFSYPMRALVGAYVTRYNMLLTEPTPAFEKELALMGSADGIAKHIHGTLLPCRAIVGASYFDAEVGRIDSLVQSYKKDVRK